MSGMLYLYALLDAPPRRSGGRGLRGERLAFLRAGGLVVAAGRMRAAPAASAAALRRHDAVVRRLARARPAVLPMRFGTTVADARALAPLIAPRAADLRRALRRVAGREQMTLRVFGAAPAAPARPPRSGGPGTRYLDARRAARGVAAPAVARLRARLGRWIRAERVEPSDSPPLLASVYHLVDREDRRAYERAVRELACRLADLRVVPSGPWAPYAFAPAPDAP